MTGARLRDRLRAAWSLRDNLRAFVVRPTSRVAPLDGVRGLAALTVVAAHMFWMSSVFIDAETWQEFATEPWGVALLQTQLMVDVFFIISGYLIGGMLLAEHRKAGGISIPRFYRRRALRILPPYLVVMALGLTAYLLPLSGDAADLALNGENAWANLLFVNNYLSPADQYLAHTWSLGVEGQFYLLFPLLLLVLLRWPGRLLSWLWLLFGVAVVIRAVITATSGAAILPLPFNLNLHQASGDLVRFFDSVYLDTHTRFGTIVLGVLLAAWDQDRGLAETVERHPRLTGILGIGALAWLVTYFALPVYDTGLTWSDGFAFGYVAFSRYASAAAVALVFGLLIGAHPWMSGLRRALSWRGWYPVAQMSYSLYLAHPLVIVASYILIPSRGTGLPDPWILVVLQFGGSLLLGAVLYLFVERPFIALRGSRAYRPREAGTARGGSTGNEARRGR